jgi:MFS family permease
MAANRRVIWATLSLDLFLWGLLNSIFGPSSLRIMGEFNADFATIGIAVSAMSFGAMFSIFTGRYADKYGSYYISRLSLFFLGLATFLTGFTNSIFLFIVLSFLAGISVGTFQASFTQAILDLYPEAKLKMLSFNAVFFGVGATIGPTVTALLISSFNDWRVAYILFGGLLAASVFFQFSLKSSSRERMTPSIDRSEQKGTSFLV